jgi:hypothetical protein
VQRVAQRHIRPDQAAIVVVGDATQVLAGLEAIAPVVLYDVEGQPMQRSALQVGAATERFDGTRLRPQTLTYQLMVQGNAMGTVTEQLRREGADWIATSAIESPVMQQRTEVRFAAADFTPREVRLSGGQGPAQMQVNLQVADGRVRGRAELPPQAGGARDVDIEMVGGMLLPGMDAYVLAAAPLREGYSATLPVFNMMGGGATNVTYRVAGSEEITVAAGTFPAFRIELTGAPQPMTIWVRRDAPHIMLRQEYVGMPVRVDLQSVQ